MHLLKLISRNALRHKLRTSLTVLGLVVAVVAFGLLQTVVGAWYAKAEAAKANRLITRNAISLVFSMPLAYRQKIRAIEGVKQVSLANWVGSIYKEPKNFFAQFAVDDAYFDAYPEYVMSEQQKHDYLHDRKGCIVGRRLAETYGFKVGDSLAMRGAIYPGDWNFVIRAIYDGAEKNTDTAQMFFHWDYLNETVKIRYLRRLDQVGVYIVVAADSDNSARIALDVDKLFKNSAAETLTETEKAFQLGFISMSATIVEGVRLVSYLVIFIIMAVMANTIAMTVRERTSEYATLKALGFGPAFVGALIYGESLVIALTGGVLGVLLTFPVAAGFASQLGKFFPVFQVSAATVQLQVVCAVVVGLLAAVVPARHAGRIKIVDGLRSIA